MDDRPTDPEAPLRSERREREKWRKDETFLDEQDAPGHILPESERDRATSRTGPMPAAGAVPPPD